MDGGELLLWTTPFPHFPLRSPSSLSRALPPFFHLPPIHSLSIDVSFHRPSTHSFPFSRFPPLFCVYFLLPLSPSPFPLSLHHLLLRLSLSLSIASPPLSLFLASFCPSLFSLPFFSSVHLPPSFSARYRRRFPQSHMRGIARALGQTTLGLQEPPVPVVDESKFSRVLLSGHHPAFPSAAKSVFSSRVKDVRNGQGNLVGLESWFHSRTSTPASHRVGRFILLIIGKFSMPVRLGRMLDHLFHRRWLFSVPFPPTAFRDTLAFGLDLLAVELFLPQECPFVLDSM